MLAISAIQAIPVIDTHVWVSDLDIADAAEARRPRAETEPADRRPCQSNERIDDVDKKKR